MTVSAEVIAFSAYKTKNQFNTLATMKLRYPLMIHAEFMTHRDFSRSASSMRAVPTERIIAQVEEDLAMPSEFGANKAGMQAGPEIAEAEAARLEWRQAAADAIYRAKRLSALGLHKQVINRILSPYAHISVVVTSSVWQNFFDLRVSEFADPTMYELAEAMQRALYAETPRLLMPGQWHTPFVNDGTGGEQDVLQSAAMCARVSFLRHDGQRPTWEENERLAARLLRDKHMSPFEHQARAARGRFYNLHGWRSFRFDLENPDRAYKTPYRKYTPFEKIQSKPELREDESFRPLRLRSISTLKPPKVWSDA